MALMLHSLCAVHFPLQRLQACITGLSLHTSFPLCGALSFAAPAGLHHGPQPANISLCGALSFAAPAGLHHGPQPANISLCGALSFAAPAGLHHGPQPVHIPQLHRPAALQHHTERGGGGDQVRRRRAAVTAVLHCSCQATPRPFPQVLAFGVGTLRLPRLHACLMRVAGL